MQEVGRAGRVGQQATAVMFFNNSDLASNRKGMTTEMVKYCRNNDTCLRLYLVQYFGFEDVLFEGNKEDCCKNCRNQSVSSEQILEIPLIESIIIE